MTSKARFPPFSPLVIRRVLKRTGSECFETSRWRGKVERKSPFSAFVKGGFGKARKKFPSLENRGRGRFSSRTLWDL